MLISPVRKATQIVFMKNKRLCKVWSERHLPVDLWPEILSRLPVKSLLRFRCVSKSWLSFIDNADFARIHLKNFKNNRDETHLFVVQDWAQRCVVRSSSTFRANSLTLGSIVCAEDWHVVCSIDGLVLLKNYSRGRKGAFPFPSLKVWNPSIRKFHEFPSMPDIETSTSSTLMDVDIGLGYDLLANDYKHVKVIAVHSVAVYTLGTGCWNIIQFQGKGCSYWHWQLIYDYVNAIYFQGSLYLIAKDVDNQLLQEGVLELVSFDLSSEVFSSIRLPGDPVLKSSGFFKPPGFTRWNELVLIDGGCSLAVFYSSSPDKTLWVLESSGAENGSMCWTKRYSFDSTVIQVLFHKKNGDILTQRCREETFAEENGPMFWRKPIEWDQLALYCPETDEYKILQQRKGSFYWIRHVSGYVESLILLK